MHLLVDGRLDFFYTLWKKVLPVIIENFPNFKQDIVILNDGARPSSFTAGSIP
jgi:hypothetical protein